MSAVYYMDIRTVTDEMPILYNLQYEDKMKYIQFYQDFLSKKPRRQVECLKTYMKNKLQAYGIKKIKDDNLQNAHLSSINSLLIDQYQRLLNLIELSLIKRPISSYM